MYEGARQTKRPPSFANKCSLKEPTQIYSTCEPLKSTFPSRSYCYFFICNPNHTIPIPLVQIYDSSPNVYVHKRTASEKNVKESEHIIRNKSVRSRTSYAFAFHISLAAHSMLSGVVALLLFRIFLFIYIVLVG